MVLELYSMINRILDDNCREALLPLTHKMFEACPEMMSRKPLRANVQQAFAVNLVENIATATDRILCVGSYEDTAYEYLKKIGYKIDDIDPVINFDLHTFKSMMQSNVFDIIFSVSVIEHVENDEEFVADICTLLKPGGIGIITCDFLEGYQKWMQIPACRYYTSKDLDTRLNDVLNENGCHLLRKPSYVGEPDFYYQGHTYNLATFVFKKVI